MARTFTADYSTGNFNQWWLVQNVATLNDQTAFRYNPTQNYNNAVIANDVDGGYAARYEVRPGDIVSAGNERSEVADIARAINVTRWEAFSIKFDENYPLDCSAYTDAWAVTNQWTDATGLGWTCTPNFLDGATPSGTWSLNYFQGTDRNIRLLDVPMNRGNWIDVKMNIGWYANSSGFVKVWINGVRQNLRYGSWASPRLVAPTVSPSDTFTGQTVWNNTSGTFYYKEGLYRNGSAGYPTGIIYHANYRTSSTEDGL